MTSPLTPSHAAERLARIRKHDTFNALLEKSRWPLPRPDPSDQAYLSSPLDPLNPVRPRRGLTRRRHGRFKVLAHLVSFLIVDHRDDKWKLLADLFVHGLTGVDRIVLVGTANPIRLAIWLVVFSGLVVTTVYFIALTLIAYFEYATIVSVSRLTGNLRILPAITVCNVNPFRRDVLCDRDAALYSVREPMCERAATSNTFVLHMTKFKGNSATNATLAEFIERSEYVWQDLIVSCKFADDDCSPSWIQEVVVSFYRYGRCFCIFCNISTVDESVDFVDQLDPRRGLQLELDTQRDTYLNSSVDIGFLVMVHDRNHLPDPNIDGWSS